MKPLVIDASAAIAYVRGEPGAAQVERSVRGRETVRVPWLFWTEVINVLSRRHGWPGTDVLGAVYDLEQLRLRTEPPSRPTMLAVIDAVETHGLSAYDAEYLVLAENTDAEFLTGDVTLANAAGARAILVGSGRRLAEPTRAYLARDALREPDWPRWPGAVAYMEELRRDSEADLAAIRRSV